MGHIACLPESVVSHLRSSIVLSDIPQIVEELVCNSLDAEATQVSVQILSEDFHIVIEDNGCGITESNFALLGERHATSKIHNLEDLETGIKTLGFRGEALSSLSDVALLDIASRARGCPNAFRKIVKAGITLSFERSAEPKDSGTKVVVREVFCNQPVRRRLFGSSHKKVLQAVRERVLRLALMHPRVAIVVKDTARQEVFRSRPVESLEAAMADIFGSKLCSGLEELDFAKGNLRLSGFLSKRSHRLSSKTVQFVYINRRFVQKTPIHKLLNAFGCNDCEVLKESSRKRNYFPAFVLNLTCPLDYDITFEASKTLVEFTDWKPVLSFAVEILRTTWGVGEDFPEDTPDEPRHDLQMKENEEHKKRTKCLEITPLKGQHTKMEVQSSDQAYGEGRFSRFWLMKDSDVDPCQQAPMAPEEIAAMSPRKRLKVVGTRVSSMMRSATDTKLQPTRNRERPDRNTLQEKKVKDSMASFNPEPSFGSPVRGIREFFVESPPVLDLVSPDLSFESPGPSHYIWSDFPAPGTGTGCVTDSSNMFEDIEPTWSLTRCNQDQVASTPDWDITTRPNHLRLDSQHFYTRKHLCDDFKDCSAEQGSPTQHYYHSDAFNSYPTPELLASTKEPPRTRSTQCRETSFSFQEERVEEFSIQKTRSTVVPSTNNTSILEEASEVAISKWRRKSFPALSGAEFKGTPRQGSVAEMYQAWINPSTRVEGREIIDIASNPEHNFVPESLTKEKLQHARVLQQVDKKFIAVTAKGVLVLVDQHAADERVRLEQLRREVLELAKRKAVTVLDQPEELSLTPMNQQVLETYSEQIQHWGWRFKIVPQILSGRAYKVLVNAVPNILNTKLWTKDLIDYLNQLRETHGSSAAPPAVTRILNYKSCRGAIMFGDTLLPSECHQLLAHLKQTSLCFQCAHGRPTMVPLVDLPVVHECYSPVAGQNKFGGAKRVDIKECEVQTPNGKVVFKTFRSSSGRPPKGTNYLWHGLEQCVPASLERARIRLQNALEMCEPRKAID